MGELTTSIILDERLNIIEAGKGCEAFLGGASPESCRDKPLDQIAPQAYALIKDLVAKAGKGKAVENYTIPLKVEQRLTQVLVSVIPYPLSTLGINGVLVTFSTGGTTGAPGPATADTEEGAHEEEMEQPPLFPRIDALAYLADGLFLADMRGRLSYANPALVELTGYSSGQLTEKRLVDLLQGSFEKAVWERVLETVRLSNWEGELNLAGAEGSAIPVSISLSTLRDSGGSPVGLVGVVRDLRSAHSLQAAKEASLGRLWSMLEQSPSALVSFTPDFRVTLWNAAATALLGWGSDRMIGTNLLELVQEDYREFMESAVGEPGSQLFRGGIDVRFLAAEGAELYLRLKGVAIETAGRAQEWLLLMDKIPEPGAKGPDEECEERLRQAEREVAALRDSEDIRAELTAQATKELREPLTSITACAILLRDNLDSFMPGETHALLEHVNEASQRICTLLQEMVHIPTARALPIPVSRRRVNLGALASDVLDSMNIPAERYRVVCEFADDFPDVASDPDKLKQVFYRLVDNAVKYSPDGGYIGLSGRLIGDNAMISIRDRGLGMEAVERRHVFRRLHVLPDVDPLGVDGMKLGLYLCKRYVQELGGELWAESEPGVGTTVHFTLPLHTGYA